MSNGLPSNPFFFFYVHLLSHLEEEKHDETEVSRGMMDDQISPYLLQWLILSKIKYKNR